MTEKNVYYKWALEQLEAICRALKDQHDRVRELRGVIPKDTDDPDMHKLSDELVRMESLIFAAMVMAEPCLNDRVDFDFREKH